jgi:hypothetical protein
VQFELGALHVILVHADEYAVETMVSHLIEEQVLQLLTCDGAQLGGVQSLQ